LAPVLLGSDLAGRWSEYPTTLISWLDGQADITPTDLDAWATQLGHGLATVHAMSCDRLSALPSVFEGRGGSREVLEGPIATRIRSDWSQITASPQVLTHSDCWSGNVVWRDGVLTGIVDWSGGARGPRGFDVGWCRLDLYLLFDARVADVFLAAYEDATGHPVADVALWDGWAVARSHDRVETWAANYRPLGRADLDGDELRRRHSQWTSRLLEQKGQPPDRESEISRIQERLSGDANQGGRAAAADDVPAFGEMRDGRRLRCRDLHSCRRVYPEPARSS
jgi:Ser/Thr protein kinase RdoA (MazF antagonist)